MMNAIQKTLSRFFQHPTIHKLQLHPMRLNFKDVSLETDFLDSYFAEKFIQMRLGIIVGIVFYAFFGILDYLLVPHNMCILWFIRFGVVIPIGILGLLVSFSKYFKHSHQLVLSIVTFTAGAGIIAMVLLAPPPITYSYYAGLILTFTFVYTLVGLRFVWSSATNWILVILYEFSVLTFTNTPTSIFITNNFFFLSTNFIGMFAAYAIELSTRRNFYSAYLLKIEKDKVSQAKGELENLVKKRTLQLSQSNEQLKQEVTEKNSLIEEQRQLQAQLVQSQKMEAVGLLAGGIAHDFNNLLTVINGYSDLLLLALTKGTSNHDKAQQIKDAGNRAETLTRQLLAFSRKQIMHPDIIDVNQLLRDFEKIIFRLIGENIEVILSLDEDLGNIKVDRGQLEQVILNLAVNARDAMPKGGTLSIKTENRHFDHPHSDYPNFEVGDYLIALTISDTGVGISQENLPHIFDPFFTTKAVDKGTGLGLSTVYGIIQQSDGHIYVESKKGKGTTFTILFKTLNDTLLTNKNPQETICLKGTETILLVEDEDAVRTYAESILREYGYRFYSASNGVDATNLFLIHQHEIDILVTDVIMPKMNGKEIVDELRLLEPKLKYIFMSGYTNNEIAPYDILDDAKNFIQKPFTPTTLFSTLRKILDETP